MQIEIKDKTVKAAYLHGKEYSVITPACGCTHDSLDYVKEQLLRRMGNEVSALEIKNGFREGQIDKFHYSTYLLADYTRGEIILLLGAFAKGYSGEGSRGALTLDNYLDLFNIPVKRVRAKKEAGELTSLDDLARLESDKLALPRASVLRYTSPDAQMVCKLTRRAKDRGRDIEHKIKDLLALKDTSSPKDALRLAAF